MKRVTALGAILALLLAPVLVRLLNAQAPSPAPPPTYTLTDLGSTIGASGIDSFNVRAGATALNSNAQVAGYRLNLSFGDQPIGFLWDKGNFTDLGTGGGPQSYAYGINNAGQIVGISNFVASSNFSGDLTGNSRRAFIYQNGVMAILDPDPNSWSHAYAINAGGDVAGFINNNGPYLPVIWRKAATIGASPHGAVRSNNVVTITTTFAHNFAAGDSATIVGISDVSFNGLFTIASVPSTTTFTYAQSGADATSGSGAVYRKTRLPSLLCFLVTSCQGEALAINDLGQAAGWSVGGNVNAARPVMWDSNGQPTDLIPNPGYYTEANGINNNSVVVGYYQPQQTSNTPIHAFSWQSGALTDLGAVGNDTYSGAWGINSKGDIVGISGTNANPILVGTGGGGRAFLYTGGNMYDLIGLLVSGTNWSLDAAYAINDNGQIVGTGRAPDGTEHGYLLTPFLMPTTTTLSSSASLSVFGQQVSLTATVTPTTPSSNTPTGTVTFSDGATVLGSVTPLNNGVAILNTSALGVGAHNITASYGGDNQFGSSTSATLIQTVNQAATTTALSASPNPANLGQTVTFAATVAVVAPGVGTPTGTVTFLDGSTTLGIGVLSPAGTVTLSTSSLAAGSHTVTASYGGDATFASSTSTGVIVTVQGPPPPVQITDNETIHVADSASLPDVFDSENVKVTDAVWVASLIQISAPVVEFSAASLGFGGQNGTQTITVSDIGTASLTVASAAISGSSQFSITQTTCSSGATSFSTVLPSGGACVLTIGYSASATPANDNATLTFTDNAGLSNVASIPVGSSFTQSIPLSGAGSTTNPPPPPPAVIPIMDDETIHVTDTPSFADVFDSEQISVADQVSVIPCDFTLSANSPLNVPVGGSGSTSITITSVNGCALQVSLSAPSPFLGATVSLPSTATTGGSSTSATLTVTAGPSVTPTSFTVIITGTSGLTHSVSVNVNITASIAGTMGVVQTLLNAGAINNSGVAGALTGKLSAAQSAPNAQTSINTVKAFQNQVQAQAGKHIATSLTLAGVTFNPASTLMANGQALIDSFRVGMIPDPITGYVVNSSGMAVPGATVSIADATGTVVASATTDVTGFYFMATTGILVPGANYNIRVSTLPSGFTNASPSSQSFTWQGVAVAFNNFVLN